MYFFLLNGDSNHFSNRNDKFLTIYRKNSRKSLAQQITAANHLNFFKFQLIVRGYFSKKKGIIIIFIGYSLHHQQQIKRERERKQQVGGMY